MSVLGQVQGRKQKPLQRFKVEVGRDRECSPYSQGRAREAGSGVAGMPAEMTQAQGAATSELGADIRPQVSQD